MSDPDPQQQNNSGIWQAINELLAALHRVHFELGSGFLHQIYRRATMVQLKEQEIGYKYIKKIPIFYRKRSDPLEKSGFLTSLKENPIE